MTIKVYRNDSKQTLDVLGLGEIPAGEKVSVSSDYPPTVIVENYPGLVDVIAEEEAAAANKAEVADEAPAKDEGVSNNG